MSSRPILLALAFVAIACSEPPSEETAFADSLDLPAPIAGDTIGPERREADAGLRVLAAAQLIAADSGAQVLGSARILETRIGASEGVQVTLETNGLPPGTHAWHLHDGPCSEPAPVLAPLGDASTGRPLEIRDRGVGEASVYLAGDALPHARIGSGQLSLRIHERADGGPIIACADL